MGGPAAMPRQKQARNDPARLGQGQGKKKFLVELRMIATLPPQNHVRVTTGAIAISETTLAKADAVVIAFERGAAAVARLEAVPFGALLRPLFERERAAGNEWPVLVTRLPNRPQTLAAVGFVKPGAAATPRRSSNRRPSR